MISPVSTPRPLDQHRSEIERAVASAEALLVQLDFDGTLAPIVTRPSDARIFETAKAAVTHLSTSSGITVAILSGRSLDDIRERVGLANLIYAGNHGMEIWREGAFEFTEASAEECREDLRVLSAGLARALDTIEGVEVEDKGLTASIHYRRVAERQRATVMGAVERAVAEFQGRLRITRGSMVVEVRPAVNWNKGTAALWIRQHIGNNALAVYVGDDTTDEDAFAALPDGVTIRVGCDRESYARYCVASPEEVPGLLCWLALVFRRTRLDG